MEKTVSSTRPESVAEMMDTAHRARDMCKAVDAFFATATTLSEISIDGSLYLLSARSNHSVHEISLSHISPNNTHIDPLSNKESILNRGDRTHMTLQYRVYDGATRLTQEDVMYSPLDKAYKNNSEFLLLPHRLQIRQSCSGEMYDYTDGSVYESQPERDWNLMYDEMNEAFERLEDSVALLMIHTPGVSANMQSTGVDTSTGSIPDDSQLPKTLFDTK